MRIEADTLQEAFSKAAAELSCSVTKLDIQVLQHPRAGVFGMFKKPAIIEAFREGEAPKKQPVVAPECAKEPAAVEVCEEKYEEERRPRPKKHRTRRKKEHFSTEDALPVAQALEEVETPLAPSVAPRGHSAEEPAFSRQRDHAVVEEVLGEIEAGVRALVSSSCFAIGVMKVEAHDAQTVLIEINGEDAALLIGKEGYRYKAFSYLLYNWINMKYGLGIRLEIAQFLHNQEEMIENYLTPIVERIESQGRGQTKPLDGVLIKIALEKLRNRFPEKYVGIKTGREGRKFVVVNDFNRKNP